MPKGWELVETSIEDDEDARIEALVEERDSDPLAAYDSDDNDLGGVSGQDRESYSDTQDRDSYTVDPDLEG